LTGTNTPAYSDLSSVTNKESFVTLLPVADFIKLFRQNLCRYRCIALSFGSGYGAWGVNHTEKSFFN
jgi:hypothetical protein